MKKLAALAALPLALTACSSGSGDAAKTVTVSATPSGAASPSDTPSSATNTPTDAADDTTATTETDDSAETQTATSDATEAASTSDYPTSDTADTPGTEAADTTTSDGPTDEATSESPADTPATTAETPAAGGQVDSAISSARSYLAYSAFSKQGLIDQLSSPYGEKYPLTVATQAVNSLTDVDWNEQAVKSAQSYLKTQAFSCAGLTDQLSSAYGEKFTPAQAAYGASQTSACK